MSWRSLPAPGAVLGPGDQRRKLQIAKSESKLQTDPMQQSCEEAPSPLLSRCQPDKMASALLSKSSTRVATGRAASRSSAVAVRAAARPTWCASLPTDARFHASSTHTIY